MNDDFKREEVIELAERLYVLYMSTEQFFNENHAESRAKIAIKQAMVFRKIEREIFKEKDG